MLKDTLQSQSDSFKGGKIVSLDNYVLKVQRASPSNIYFHMNLEGFE